MKRIYSWYMNSKYRLWVMGIVSLMAGLSLLISPEKTPHFIIRGVGLVWVLEGIIYGLDIYNDYLRNKKW